MDFALQPVSFEDMPGWEDDDSTPLFAMMARCHRHLAENKPYKTGLVGIEAVDLAEIFAAAPSWNARDANAARAFFETHFQPCKITRNDQNPGLVTAFYEPEVAVSALRDEVWRYPFYQRPDDLVDLDDQNRPASLDPSYMFGQRTGEGIMQAYADRQAIDRGYLEGRGLEIAWAKSRIDVFFAHIQGAARLRFPDGRLTRITYAAKAGHPFTAIGRYLVDKGEIALAYVSMGSIRHWLTKHPDRMDEVLWQNRSYIFFRHAPVEDDDLGPVAAAKVPLVAGRSLAVDRLIHTFSSPFYIVSDSLRHLDGGKPFRRLMLALDTGTAIVGAARGDIFTGSGDAAGDLAGNVRNDADFYLLVPNRSLQKVL